METFEELALTCGGYDTSGNLHPPFLGQWSDSRTPGRANPSGGGPRRGIGERATSLHTQVRYETLHIRRVIVGARQDRYSLRGGLDAHVARQQ